VVLVRVEIANDAPLHARGEVDAVTARGAIVSGVSGCLRGWFAGPTTLWAALHPTTAATGTATTVLSTSTTTPTLSACADLSALAPIAASSGSAPTTPPPTPSTLAGPSVLAGASALAALAAPTSRAYPQTQALFCDPGTGAVQAAIIGACQCPCICRAECVAGNTTHRFGKSLLVPVVVDGLDAIAKQRTQLLQRGVHVLLVYRAPSGNALKRINGQVSQHGREKTGRRRPQGWDSAQLRGRAARTRNSGRPFKGVLRAEVARTARCVGESSRCRLVGQ
jgi:hypothetical protein